MKHGAKIFFTLSIGFLVVALFVSPIIARAGCEAKLGVTQMVNGELVDIQCEGSCFADSETECARNRMCCFWVNDNTTTGAGTQTQNNNQSQLSGTIWQGAKVEAAVRQSNPLVFTPQVGLPGFLGRYEFTENSTAPIAKLMKAIFSYGIQVVGFITLIVIIIGGFLWSIAGGNSSKVTEAKQWIFSGLGGLVLLMFSYLILRTINVDLVNFRVRDIDAITKLNLIIAEKSNQDQVIGDQGFLDGTYGEVICDGGLPDKEACCVFYNENSIWRRIAGETDYLRAFSMAYCEQNNGKQKAINKCLEFGRKQAMGDPGGNGRLYQDNLSERVSGAAQFYNRDWSATTILNPNTQIYHWGKSNFERQQDDLGLYFIKGKACWDFSSYIADATIGLDSPRYCSEVANDNNGWACIVTNNGKKSWGYCDNDVCSPCSSYGTACSINHQCPHKKEAIGNSTVVAEWQCGNGGISGLAHGGGNCKNSYCQCSAPECFEECKQNLSDQNRLNDICGGN